MFRIDLLAVGIEALITYFGDVEKMPGLELIVPCPACTSLIEEQGFFTLCYTYVFMVLYLPEERR